MNTQKDCLFALDSFLSHPLGNFALILIVRFQSVSEISTRNKIFLKLEQFAGSYDAVDNLKLPSSQHLAFDPMSASVDI